MSMVDTEWKLPDTLPFAFSVRVYSSEFVAAAPSVFFDKNVTALDILLSVASRATQTALFINFWTSWESALLIWGLKYLLFWPGYTAQSAASGEGCPGWDCLEGEVYSWPLLLILEFKTCRSQFNYGSLEAISWGLTRVGENEMPTPFILADTIHFNAPYPQRLRILTRGNQPTSAKQLETLDSCLGGNIQGEFSYQLTWLNMPKSSHDSSGPKDMMPKPSKLLLNAAKNWYRR